MTAFFLIFCVTFAALQARRALGVGAAGRLDDLDQGSLRRRAFGRGKSSDTAHPVESAQALATLIAHLENGGDFRDQLEKFAGRHFAGAHLTERYVSEAFSGASSADGVGEETRSLLSSRVLACGRLSESLGCALAGSLRVVKELCAQEQHVEDLRAKAFSMPKATIKLLSALPLLTLTGGEVLGAHPFAFLLGSAAGRVCAGVGFAFFAAGVWWIRRLMRDFSRA